MNPIDRAIRYVAPIRAARRAQARLQIHALEQAKAYYDGADLGRRGSSIRRSAVDANAVTARTLPKLRAGSHDLVRNNAHAHRGVEAIVSNTVGTGILARFKRQGQSAPDLATLARETLDTTAIDVLGQHDYYGLQALALNTTVESGEALVVRQWDSSLAFPMQFMVLEPDYLDSSKDGLLKDGGRIVQGVEFDARGRRRRYWLFPEHPGGRRGFTRFASIPIAASEVAHIYRVERPGQVRGIPWLAPVMLQLADWQDYSDAQLIRQKIAACFAVFYTDSMATQAASTTDTKEKVEPGMITRLSSGADVKFGVPPQVTGYKEYARVTLRAIASGLGISYEALTADLEGVSFTSGRMGWIEFQRNIDRWRWLMLIPQGCEVMLRWWLEGASLLGHDTDGVQVTHAPPRRAMLQPEREVPALTSARRAGITTLAEIAQESGRDLDELLDELAEEQRMLDARGIVLDSDARKTSAAGLTQARTGTQLVLPPTGDPDQTGAQPSD